MRLLQAVNGRKPFRRFKDALYDLGIQQQWYDYKEARLLEIAREWCLENGVDYAYRNPDKVLARRKVEGGRCAHRGRGSRARRRDHLARVLRVQLDDPHSLFLCCVLADSDRWLSWAKRAGKKAITALLVPMEVHSEHICLHEKEYVEYWSSKIDDMVGDAERKRELAREKAD